MIRRQRINGVVGVSNARHWCTWRSCNLCVAVLCVVRHTFNSLLRRLRREDCCELEASLGNIVCTRPGLDTKTLPHQTNQSNNSNNKNSCKNLMNIIK